MDQPTYFTLSTGCRVPLTTDAEFCSEIASAGIACDVLISHCGAGRTALRGGGEGAADRQGAREMRCAWRPWAVRVCVCVCVRVCACVCVCVDWKCESCGAGCTKPSRGMRHATSASTRARQCHISITIMTRKSMGDAALHKSIDLWGCNTY